MVYNSLYDFKRSIVLLCFLAISVLQHAIGQENTLKFHLVEGASGINLGKVNAIAQDADGFIWFSDQSLRSIIRYDGHSMLRYSYDQNEPNGLGGFYPECLIIDSSGIIWIGFYGQGLDRFDPVTNTFKHFDHDPNDPGSLINNTVSAVLRDSKGNTWVGTDGGISVLEESTGKFIHYTHNPDDPKSLSHNIVRSLYEDKEGTIWIGTGMAFSLDGLGGLNRFNPSDSSFTRYIHDSGDPTSISDNKVRAIFEDSKGNFWIGTGGKDGLHTMDRATGNFKRYSYDSKNPNALSRGPLTNTWDHVTFITEDSENQIWIGTESSGVRRFDPESKRTEHYINTSESGIIAGFKDLSGWSALVNADGLIWMTTQQSTFYKVDLFNTVIDHVEVSISGAHSGGNSFIDDSMGNVWLASNYGLLRTDKMGTILEEYSHDDQNPTSISNNFVWDIIKGPQGYIWAVTSAGVNRFDSDSQTFKRYLTDLDAGDILYDRDSTVWIATNTQGVFALNVYNDEIRHFAYDPQNVNTIAGNLINSLEMDAFGNIYIGHGNGDGISRINISSGRVMRLLSGISAYWLKKDKNNSIWACTPNGLYVKGQDGADFVQLVEMYPDVDISSWTKSIVEDEEGNLWVGAADGMYKINPERNNLIRFGKENGIVGASDELLANAHLGVSGLIYFTSPVGYFVFDPQKIREFDDDTQLFFTDMWVNGKHIEKKKKFELGKNSSDIQPILLKHNENLIGLRFSVTDFRAGGNQAIKYKLDNYDGEWRQALSGERVNYYNLPPGDYKFYIKTKKNINGQIVQKSLDFSIAKPWWTRWWAYMLFAFILISGIYAIIKYRTRKLLKEKQILEEKVNERTTDLNRSLNDLKATQAQLIQSEKMASLGELTAGIAHEIQNPLNFVNNFSEVNKELLDELEEEITNGDFEEVKSIAKDLKANEEKINHHGKRADAIVKGMLQHSRTSTGEKEYTDINELADEYLRLAYHGLRAKDSEFNASFDTDLDPELPKVKVIPQDIGRVLLNLINNAFQAVHEKSQTKIDGYAPKVSIKTNLSPSGGDKGEEFVVISIIDNGSGIPNEIKEKIFQPFFTTKPTGQGTGLGLSLSYDIVKVHGGEIRVESEENEGTTFIITLPIETIS